MAQKVTLKDIAREVGLSSTSVSLVLNNRPNKVSEANREKIRSCARRLNYVPNQFARSLVTSHSHTLGLIVPNIESRFFASVAKNLEQKCRERGYALFIVSSDESSRMDAELVRLLLNRGVDGMFLVLSHELEPDPDLLELLKMAPTPYVLVDRVIAGVNADRVRFNSVMGGYVATKHLLEAGHRRIAAIINMATNTGQERLRGYRRALAEAQVAYDESLVFNSDYYIPNAYKVAEAMLETGASAVFASSDNIALGVLKRAYEKHVRVPEDLSMVSFDNSAADALFEPALTSIEQNTQELTEQAVELLFARIEADSSSDGEEQAFSDITLEPRLVLKESVKTLS